MLAVIIPTFNEEEHIYRILLHLQKYGDSLEIIVVDGGSKDSTCAIVQNFNHVKLITSELGRSKQMHAGALEAKSKYFFFLHADSVPPKDFSNDILSSLNRAGVSGGSFCMEFDHQHPLLKMYSAFTGINHTLFTYGDQGLFLTRKNYFDLGGFKPLCFMEDIEFQMRIRRAGSFVKVRKPIITSARRYEMNGFFRQQMKNNKLVLMYHLGWSPDALKRRYEGE